MRQHDGKAASAEEKGREGGSNLHHISSGNTTSKLLAAQRCSGDGVGLVLTTLNMSSEVLALGRAERR